MNEDEAIKLVADKFQGQAVPIPRLIRFQAWLIEVVHPLLHHKVRHVILMPDETVIDNGWACRLCGRSM